MSRNIRLLEIFNICLNGLFIMPVLIPYYRDEIWLNFQQLFFIPLSVAVGWLVTRSDIGSGLRGIAVWLTLAGIFILLWAWKRRRASPSTQS